MGFTSSLIGGCLGFGMQAFSNALRKVPLSRKPWMHVFMFTGGCWMGSYLPKVEKSLVQDINEMRAAKGLPPMVGTSAWIRYSVPEDESQRIVK